MIVDVVHEFQTVSVRGDIHCGGSQQLLHGNGILIDFTLVTRNIEIFSLLIEFYVLYDASISLRYL